MQDGPNPFKHTYSRQDVLKFSQIARLTYEAKQLALKALTEDERTKYNAFYQSSANASYNERMPTAVHFSSTPLVNRSIASIPENEITQAATSSSANEIAEAPLNQAAAPLVYSRGTRTRQTGRTLLEITYAATAEQEEDDYLASVEGQAEQADEPAPHNTRPFIRRAN